MMHKNIIITGSSSGIGKALAAAYSHPNSHLLLLGRNIARLKETAKLCEAKGATVTIKAVDVADVEKMSEVILEFDTHHPVDLAIANAGIGTGQVKKNNNGKENPYILISTNVVGMHATVEPLIERMKERRAGQIALMGSIGGYRGFSKYFVYNATKAYVKVFGEGLRLFLEPFDVRVSVIAPGFIKTPLTDCNPFPMPFLMSPIKAAKLIRKGLQKDKPIIAFPFVMYLLIRLIAMLPVSLGNFVAKNALKN